MSDAPTNKLIELYETYDEILSLQLILLLETDESLFHIVVHFALKHHHQVATFGLTILLKLFVK